MMLRTKIESWLRRLIHAEEGINLVLLAGGLTVLIGMAGVAIDGSNIYFQQQRMQIAADAAALGGARQLAIDATLDAVDGEILDLATRNAADRVEWALTPNERGVDVVAYRTIETYFARIMGYNDFTVTARAQAQYEPVTGVDGLFPLTLSCDCVDEDIAPGPGGGGGGDDDDGDGDDYVPIDGDAPKSGTVQLDDANSAYDIEFVSRTTDTWTYRVTEQIGAQDLSHWLLGIESCLDKVVSSAPGSDGLGVDGSTGEPGIKWNTNAAFTTGLFSFKLDDDYPDGTVQALAKAGNAFATVPMVGPICDGTNGGDDGGEPVGGGAKICLPVIDFETDAAGAALTAGQVIDTEWAARGVQVASHNQASYPAMIFDTAAPTGGDPDLGTANEASGGPGVGVGGGNGVPGRNHAPLGKVLIVQENTSGVPDDNANGGSLVFTFGYAVNIDDVQILDIDDYAAAGTVKAYSDSAGATLIATGKMLGLGDNGVQNVTLSAAGVRRLEVNLPAGGAVASVVSCRSAPVPAYNVGDLVWSDVNNNGLQDAGEAGIAGVEMELYATGLPQVVAKTVTNAGGQYVFKKLPPGSYEVKVAGSNFNAGKPLAGAVYSTQGAGNNALDSDFNGATGKATVVVSNADILAVDAGFRLSMPDPIVYEPITIILPDDNSKYQITFKGWSNSNKTWTYEVEEISGKDLSHVNLGIANCLDEVVSGSQSPSTGYEAGTDSSTGFVGVKWNVAEKFSKGQFSFTLRNEYPIGLVRALAKAGTMSSEVDIAGPDCDATTTPPPDEPPPLADPPSEDPSPNACAFHWVNLDKDDSLTTPQKLAGYMAANPSPNDVWRLRDVIPPGPDVEPNAFVNNALQGSIGQTVKIPLAQYNGYGYKICGFANVKLVDYSLEEGNTWVMLQFLNDVIRGVETDPLEDDYGARDVRFYD